MTSHIRISLYNYKTQRENFCTYLQMKKILPFQLDADVINLLMNDNDNGKELLLLVQQRLGLKSFHLLTETYLKNSFYVTVPLRTRFTYFLILHILWS